MRSAKERQSWSSLKKAYAKATPTPFVLGDGSSIDLSAACTVLSGRNGSGKSRLLRTLQAHLGSSCLFLDMHHLCEQALMVLRSRTDLGEMVEEFDVFGPDEDRHEDVSRVVGRNYDSLEWYALEIEPELPEIAAKFRWTGGQDDPSLIPYFRAQYRDMSYSSKDMGLGEFSVNFLFWILEQYRDTTDITLLLDEPDAYLPPIGVERLLDRLLAICLRRKWRLIVSTHSEEMIARALEEDALTVLRMESGGATVALHSADTPDVASNLLSRPAIEQVLFCEDESAWHLTHALLEAHNARLARSTSVIWGEGHGYLRELHKALPQPPQSEINFAYVFDGDQRGTEGQLPKRWPAVYLPTTKDPDTLFQAAATEVETLATRLGTNATALQLVLDAIEAEDEHDWVNKLGEKYGRQGTLRSLASLWVELNPGSPAVFAEELQAAPGSNAAESSPTIPAAEQNEARPTPPLLERLKMAARLVARGSS